MTTTLPSVRKVIAPECTPTCCGWGCSSTDSFALIPAAKGPKIGVTCSGKFYKKIISGFLKLHISGRVNNSRVKRQKRAPLEVTLARKQRRSFHACRDEPEFPGSAIHCWDNDIFNVWMCQPVGTCTKGHEDNTWVTCTEKGAAHQEAFATGPSIN